MQRTLLEAPPEDGFDFDHKIRRRGFRLLAGVDEAGRGPLAGPVVAAAVILPEGKDLPGVVDSKKVPAARREALAEEIRQAAVSVSVGVASAEEIDRTDILRATLAAMVRAVGGLEIRPDLVLIDGPYTLPLASPHRGVVKGDARSLCIAAASIVAKVYRDQLMHTYHEQYPDYGFARHKGYPTPEHLKALRRFGPCPIHRRSFHGVCLVKDAVYGPSAGANRP
ncbi:MAG: ribonuclease HII [Desulfosoma sp.]|uniref:ribonuclease HII n=1 Tax=Desulfosoma sp. TaxID=2603217 RepID=UPI004049518F